MEQKANEGKSLLIEVDGKRYERIPVKTHIITDNDKVADVLAKYAKPLINDGDIVFMSEKAVACTQKRAVRMKDIHPRPLAKFLSHYVYKTPYGIGLGIPETMEMALQECGTLRILFAAFISVIGKMFGRRGWFYIIAGEKARSIDGPCDCTIPPYNEYVVLGPLDPEKTARQAAKDSGCPLFCIVDLNDLGGNILGVSDNSLSVEWLLKVLGDNPLGQSDEQTPVGIIREIKSGGGDEAASDTGDSGARAWFEKNLDNMLDDLRRLVAIRSVSETESDVKPFGQPCRDVLDEMLKICSEHGVENYNHEYYCGSAFLKGETDAETGIWSHLDIVPDSGDWTYPPFDGQISDGFMFGRGVQDNKCAAIIGLYLMLYFRDNNIPLKNGIRVFFGCNEECGMLDQAYYKEHCKVPERSIVIDSEFPVCYGEKGILQADLVSPAFSDAVISLAGGIVGNMVADAATLKIRDNGGLAEKLEGVGGVTRDGDVITITAAGKASHAARPETSVNAIGVLAKLVLEKDLLPDTDKNTFSFISKICDDYTGNGLGISASHEEFGELTCICGKISMDDGKAVMNINIRYPYSENGGVILAVIRSRCVEYGFKVSGDNDMPPSYVPQDSEFVKALSEAYIEVTGSQAPAFIMRGGTYARNLPEAVAFGPKFPGKKIRPQGLPEGHGGNHEPDEALNLKEFIDALEIYADSIVKLDTIQ